MHPAATIDWIALEVEVERAHPEHEFAQHSVFEFLRQPDGVSRDDVQAYWECCIEPERWACLHNEAPTKVLPEDFFITRLRL